MSVNNNPLSFGQIEADLYTQASKHAGTQAVCMSSKQAIIKRTQTKQVKRVSVEPCVFTDQLIIR